MTQYTVSQAFFLVTFGMLTPTLDLYTDLRMGLRLMKGPPKDLQLFSGEFDLLMLQLLFSGSSGCGCGGCDGRGGGCYEVDRTL